MLQLPRPGRGNLDGMFRNARHHRARHLAAAALWCAGLAAQAAEERVFDFDVLLDGKSIGTHEFRLTTAPDGTLDVRSEARFDVRVLGLVVYRYRHLAREQWRAGCLQRVEAETRDGGDLLSVSGSQRGDRFELHRPTPRASSGACVGSYAYWDQSQLQGRPELLNPQTGEFDAVRFEVLSEESIEVQGRPRAAQRHRLRGAGLSIDLWYSPEGEWLQLASPARGNRQLLYRRR